MTRYEPPSVLGIFHWRCPDCGDTAVTTYKRQPEHICPLYMEPTYRAMVRVPKTANEKGGTDA